MPVIDHKTKNIHLAIVIILGLLIAACGPILVGQKPLEELTPEEAAERAAEEQIQREWEINSKVESGTGFTGEEDTAFIYRKGGGYSGPSENNGLGSLFSTERNNDSESGAVSGVGVNSYLWRATLDTVSFMPLASADPFGGVILTDWHATPDAPGERFKLNIRILGRGLRADGINVTTFRQIQDRAGSWGNASIPTMTDEKIENAILFRARELRHRAKRQ